MATWPKQSEYDVSEYLVRQFLMAKWVERDYMWSIKKKKSGLIVAAANMSLTPTSTSGVISVTLSVISCSFLSVLTSFCPLHPSSLARSLALPSSVFHPPCCPQAESTGTRSGPCGLSHHSSVTTPLLMRGRMGLLSWFNCNSGSTVDTAMDRFSHGSVYVYIAVVIGSWDINTQKQFPGPGIACVQWWGGHQLYCPALPKMKPPRLRPAGF